MRMRVRERDCPITVGRRDHIVEATLIGTAIARYSAADRRPAVRTALGVRARSTRGVRDGWHQEYIAAGN
jgi:hypothetical protein